MFFQKFTSPKLFPEFAVRNLFRKLHILRLKASDCVSAGLEDEDSSDVPMILTNVLQRSVNVLSPKHTLNMDWQRKIQCTCSSQGPEQTSKKRAGIDHLNFEQQLEPNHLRIIIPLLLDGQSKKKCETTNQICWFNRKNWPHLPVDGSSDLTHTIRIAHGSVSSSKERSSSGNPMTGKQPKAAESKFLVVYLLHCGFLWLSAHLLWFT